MSEAAGEQLRYGIADDASSVVVLDRVAGVEADELVAVEQPRVLVDRGRAAPLDAEHLVKVEARTSRVLASGADGLRVLCVGGLPGGVYERPPWARDHVKSMSYA